MRMRKCENMCTACPFIIEGNDIKTKDRKWEIIQQANCTSYNVVHMIKCTEENGKENIYIGVTKSIMKFRVDEHKGYIVNKKTGPGHWAHFIFLATA